MKEIKGLVEQMVLSIVDSPAEVKIVEEDGENGLYYEVSVAKSDVGKLIGKKGRVAMAIRTVAKASGAKHGVRVSISIMKDPV